MTLENQRLVIYHPSLHRMEYRQLELKLFYYAYPYTTYERGYKGLHS